MLTFDALSTRYSVPIEDDARFLALLDSESYPTENAAFQQGPAAFQQGRRTLSERLNRETPARETDYDGHFGPHIVFELDAEDDTAEVKVEIARIIGEHLDWCQTLPIRPDVAARRKGEQQ